MESTNSNKFRLICFALTTKLWCACSFIGDPKIGMHVSDLPNSKRQYELIPNASFDTAYTIATMSGKMSYAADREGRVYYICTRDKDFRSYSGFGYGDLWRDAIAMQHGSVTKFRGWGSVVQVDSIWYAAIPIGVAESDTTSVRFFIQYDRLK